MLSVFILKVFLYVRVWGTCYYSLHRPRKSRLISDKDPPRSERSGTVRLIRRGGLTEEMHRHESRFGCSGKTEAEKHDQHRTQIQLRGAPLQNCTREATQVNTSLYH